MSWTEEEKKEIGETFTYDKNRGSLFRLKSYHKRYIGETFGAKNGRGYMLVRIGSKKYSVHRIAWFLIKGTEPDEIDHIDHNKENNTILNLREVDRTTQLRNRRLNKNSSTGHNGVSMENGKYKVHIGINGSKVHLGVYNTIEEATASRMSANKVFDFHKNHGLEL